MHLYTRWCAWYLFFQFTKMYIVLYLGVWSMFTYGYLTCAQQGQRKCGSDKRNRNAKDLETKIIIKNTKMVECWPQHIVFANGQKQMSEGSAPRAAAITKRQRETVSECVHTCAHTCTCMYPRFCYNNQVVRQKYLIHMHWLHGRWTVNTIGEHLLYCVYV